MDMRYAAFFRGINVGGKNIVKMADLKQLFIDLGIHKVKTYIQSGNVIFDSDLDETLLQDLIHSGFAERFGFQCDIMMRNIDEIRFLIEHLPITSAERAAAETADPDVEHLYVYFLNNPLEQLQVDAVCGKYEAGDILRKGTKEVYFLCRQSVRNSKLAAAIPKTFGTATARNWKTVSRLYDMLEAL